jgi:hypothetical protein
MIGFVKGLWKAGRSLYRLTQSGDNLDEIGKGYRQFQQDLIPSGGGGDDAAKAVTVQDLTRGADGLGSTLDDIALDSNRREFLGILGERNFQRQMSLFPYGNKTPILLDENIGSFALARELRARGYNVAYVGEVFWRGAQDSEDILPFL